MKAADTAETGTTVALGPDGGRHRARGPHRLYPAVRIRSRQSHSSICCVALSITFMINFCGFTSFIWAMYDDVVKDEAKLRSNGYIMETRLND